MGSPLYTQDGLPVVSKETYEAFLHDIGETPLNKLGALTITYATELDNENPYLSKIVSSFSSLVTEPNDPAKRKLLEVVVFTYKLMRSQMQNNKILEMLK